MRTKQPLSKVLSDYRPAPGRRFYQKMENAPWREPMKKMTNRTASPFRFGWQAAIVILIVFVALGLSIPEVRASISAWLGLSVAPSNQIPAAAVTLIAPETLTPANTAAAAVLAPAAAATITPTEVTASEQPSAVKTSVVEKPAAILQLQPQAGWNILTPAQLPDGYQFQSAYFDANNQMVILTYIVKRQLPGAADPSLTESKTITLLQAQQNDFVPMQVAPTTTVTDIQVNGQPAAYALGAWDTEFVKDNNTPNGGKMVSTWRNDLPVQNLYWQVGKIYLTVVTDDSAVSQQALIDLAASTGE